MSAQSDAFKSALNDLATRFSAKLGEMQGQIDAAVAAQAAKDDAAFKDASDQLTAMTASLGDHVDAIHQTASAAIGDATGTAPVSAPAVADTPVPVSETATTDPTGTASGAVAVHNIPDGAHNTGAPADAVDPVTGEPAAVAGEDPRAL